MTATIRPGLPPSLRLIMIDQSRARAAESGFDNKDNASIRIVCECASASRLEKNATIIPMAAVQRGPQEHTPTLSGR
jgi:hypothetical protein